jgi:hypothetical protein
MIQSTKAAVQYSIILIMDSKNVAIPDCMGGKLVTTTESCIVVGCKPDCDGETEILLSSAQEIDPGESPIFEGILATPSHKVIVSTATEDDL